MSSAKQMTRESAIVFMLMASLFVAVLLLIVFGIGGAYTAKAQTIPSDAQGTCVVTPSDFANWFETHTPSLNGVINPANSVTFPDSPNCSFYQWSKQMFLWLTSPAPSRYGGGSRIFDSPTFYDVSPPDANQHRTLIKHTPGVFKFALRAAKAGPNGLPVIVARGGRMFEVEQPKLGPRGNPIILNRLGKQIEVGRLTLSPNRKPVFLDKTGKAIPGAKPMLAKTQIAVVAAQPVLLAQKKMPIAQKFLVNRRPIFLDSSGNVIDTEPGQADTGVLLTQNGSLVYYAMMVNDVYAYFLTGVKDGGIPSPANVVGNANFPTSQPELDTITNFAAAHGTHFPDATALAVEVKTAWVEAATLPNKNDYITMNATVPTFNTANPNQWTPSGQKTVELAMVSMHVVGSAKGHPEMIWATFEHFGNAPNAAYSYNSLSGPKTVSQDTSGTWLFCASGAAAPFNEVHARFAEPNIVSAASHTITPSNILRFKAWGGAANVAPNPVDSNTAASNTEIIAINNSVSSMLPAADIRNKYFMTGSTWTIFGGAFIDNFGTAPHNTIVGGRAVGTSQLANTALETYQQVDSSYSAFGNNCFSCHRTNKVTVSHIFCDEGAGCSAGLQPLF